MVFYKPMDPWGFYGYLMAPHPMVAENGVYAPFSGRPMFWKFGIVPNL